jgi:hypothetical protein
MMQHQVTQRSTERFCATPGDDSRPAITVEAVLTALRRGIFEAESLLGTSAVVVGGLPTQGPTAWQYVTNGKGFSAPLTGLDGGPMLTRDMRVWPLLKRSEASRFQGVILLGRASSNDIVVFHGEVSKLHAQFRVDAQCYSLADRGSRNGTFVNGSRVAPDTEFVLRNEDRIRVGVVTLIFFHTPQFLELLRTAQPLRVS